MYKKWRFAAREIMLSAVAATAIYGVSSPVVHWYAEQPKHDGQVGTIEQNHIELVARPDQIVVYVTDHEGTPSESRGYAIRATIDADAPRRMFPTENINGRFELRESFPLQPNTRIVIDVERDCVPAGAVVFRPSPSNVITPKTVAYTPAPQPCSAH
ncbi:MAG: hypothetical protein WBK91_04910 [Alphaproteobacteria bacterium]